MNDFIEGAGYRDDSDAGVAGDLMGKPWSMEEVRRRATQLGKAFEPSPDIAGRLGEDLSTNGVIVLFTVEEVQQAVAMGAIPEKYEEDLIQLVAPDGLNDIAVIPAKATEKEKRQELISWFLSNNRC